MHYGHVAQSVPVILRGIKMSDFAKGMIMWAVIAIVGFAAILAITFIMLFNLFGAYMPDGFSITGIVYGVSDNEMIITMIVGAIGFCAIMFSGIGIAERKFVM
jgi:hypothetical protein